MDELQTIIDPETGEKVWWNVFLEAYAECGIIKEAARRVHMNTSSISKLKASNKEFAKRYAECEVIALEALEDEATRRAISYSDSLIMFLLKHRKPQVYGDKQQSNVDVNLHGPNNGPLEVLMSGLDKVYGDSNESDAEAPEEPS